VPASAVSVASVAAGASTSATEAAAPGLPPLAYGRYGNPRFNFWVDVPTFFKESPPPTNGDGQEWTWGTRATMTASGMNSAGNMSTQELCGGDAKKKGAMAHTITATTCWVTGKDAGKVFWERTQLAHDVFYSLRFEYDDRLKDAFDAVVTHVNASWKVSPADAPSASSAPTRAPAATKCPKGWIDECGGCYQPCNADGDCKTKGQSCQPVICAHTPYGNGCVAP
jgi:hypothetical protein